MQEKKNGLVSVIVPNYNSEKYISATIESVLAQTYKNFEILIIDDCSTDSSVKIIKNFLQKDKRVKLYILDKNTGFPAIPRNIGIDKAEGDYIAFLDSDDIWHPQKLEIQLLAMKNYRVFFSCTLSEDFSNLSEIKANFNKIINSNIIVDYINHDKLIKKNIIPNSSVVISREILNSYRFITDMRYKAIEDFHLWLNILQDYNFLIKIRENLLFYRISGSSISKSKLDMLKKNYMLYSEYMIKDKKLGWKKYLFLLSYIYHSIFRVIKGKI